MLARMRRILIGVPALLLFLYVVALTSCTTLSRHTAAPYDSDPDAAQQIERAAADWCAEREYPGGKPALPFRFDGCSWWPDGDYGDCCQTHDYAYWCGGAADARALADDELRACVAEKRGAVYGRLMWLGVRAGGHPVVPLYFRWGYGHEYAGSYPEPEGAAASAP
jgi:hypothetical protein